MDEMTLTLNSPLTEEQWDAIMDVDLENTPRIMFHTKHGQEVWYEKRKTGRWIKWGNRYKCDQCYLINAFEKPFCPNCGAKMEGCDN